MSSKHRSKIILRSLMSTKHKTIFFKEPNIWMLVIKIIPSMIFIFIDSSEITRQRPKNKTSSLRMGYIGLHFFYGPFIY